MKINPLLNPLNNPIILRQIIEGYKDEEEIHDEVYVEHDTNVNSKHDKSEVREAGLTIRVDKSLFSRYPKKITLEGDVYHKIEWDQRTASKELPKEKAQGELELKKLNRFSLSNYKLEGEGYVKLGDSQQRSRVSIEVKDGRVKLVDIMTLDNSYRITAKFNRGMVELKGKVLGEDINLKIPEKKEKDPVEKSRTVTVWDGEVKDKGKRVKIHGKGKVSKKPYLDWLLSNATDIYVDIHKNENVSFTKHILYTDAYDKLSKESVLSVLGIGGLLARIFSGR